LLAFCKHSENILQFFNLHKKFKIFFTLDYRAGFWHTTTEAMYRKNCGAFHLSGFAGGASLDNHLKPARYLHFISNRPFFFLPKCS